MGLTVRLKMRRFIKTFPLCVSLKKKHPPQLLTISISAKYGFWKLNVLDSYAGNPVIYHLIKMEFSHVPPIRVRVGVKVRFKIRFGVIIVIILRSGLGK